MYKRKITTDMALEFCRSKKTGADGIIKYYETEVDARLSKRLGKPEGRYSTLETSAVVNGERDVYPRVSDALSKSLKAYCGDAKRVLAVGLGNPDLTADALGDRVFKRLDVSRKYDRDSYVCAITPNVFGMTGIESYDVISAVSSRISPDLIIAIDALTAAASERIASAFQITDSGITPGSGVFNHRRRLDRSSLGVPVVSVGVPLVVCASTIARETCGSCEHRSAKRDMIVTPKDVDVLVEECALVIADAINATFAHLIEK